MPDVLLSFEGLAAAEKLFGVKKVDRALGRGLKKGVNKGFTVAKKNLAAAWNLKQMFFGEHLTKRVTQNTGYIKAASYPVAWRHFGARQTARGVKVKFKKTGSAQLHLDSFFSVMPNGGFGYFSKSGTRYVRRRDVRSDARNRQTYIRPRLPLEKRHGITVASMFGQRKVFEPVEAAAGTALEKEFLRQLSL